MENQLRGTPDPSLPPIQSRLPHPGPPFQPFLHQGSSWLSCTNWPVTWFSIISHFEQIVFMKLLFLHIPLFAFCCFWVLIVFSGPSGPAQALGSVPAQAGQHRAQSRLSPSQGPAHQPHVETGLFEFMTKARQRYDTKKCCFLLTGWELNPGVLQSLQLTSLWVCISCLKYSPVSRCFGETFFILKGFPNNHVRCTHLEKLQP